MSFPLVATVVGGLVLSWRRRDEVRRRREPGEFLATVSHELRTPLNAIVGWVNLLKSGRLGGAETAHAIDCIERNVQLETRLVDQLLDASRLLGRRVELVTAPVDLEALTRKAVTRASKIASAKGVHLMTHTATTPVMISADERRLADALSHILANAIKFTPEGGHIQIDLEVVGNRAVIRIADDGEGISADDLPHVFEPFLQGRTRSKRAGLGLGLAVAHQVIELHGGTISAYSAGEGRGAIFRVALPLLNNS